MKNFELLGLRDLPEKEIDRGLEILSEEQEGSEGCPRQAHMSGLIHNYLEHAWWKHVGYRKRPDVIPELQEGLSLVVEYFHGDWWTADNIRRVERERPEILHLKEWTTVEKIIKSNAQDMDRSNLDCNFRWRDQVRSGIIFGGMLEKWDEVAHICSALDADVKLEYSAGTIVDEYFQYYLCVAGNLSGQWTDGMEALLESAKKCRQRRLRQTIAAWEAAIAGEQPAFDKAFEAVVKSFVKREDDPSEYLGVGLDETVIWLIAEKHGLSFPALPDKLKAAVMTRESLGLDTPA